MALKAPSTPVAVDDPKLNFYLVSAVTNYDIRQAAQAAKSPRRYYNVHALPMYLGAVQNVERLLALGTDLRKSLVANFTGRLLDVVLKAVGLPKSTDAEQRF